MERCSRRDSDDVLLDFHDVFGGPPRRASMQEWRHSISGERGEATAEPACHVDPWKAQGEKPVFGGEGHAAAGASRRRLNVGEDFFDDIFGGSDSGGSAHGGRDSDFFTGSPRSWVLSPVKTLPEALGNSGVLAQFSLPAKVSRPMDSPLSAFNGSSFVHSLKAASFRYQGTTTVQEDMKRGGRPFYNPSHLSPNFGLENKEPLSPSKPKDNEGEKEQSKKTQGVVDSSRFHFSIYRWASAGVPVVTPLRRVNSTRMREKASPESLYSDEHDVKGENIVASSAETAVPVDPPSGVEHDLPDNNLKEKPSSPNETEGLQNVREVTLATEELEILSTSVPNGSMEEVLPDALQRKTLPQHLTQDVDMEPEEPSKRNLEDNDQKIGWRQRKLRKSEPPLVLENASDGKKRQEDGANRLNDAQVNKGSLRGSGTNVGGDRSSERVRGKVKEYIHIFSQDSLPKGKPGVSKQNEGFREKERVPNERKPIHTVCELDNVLQAQSFRKAHDNGNAASNREENNSSKNLFSDTSSEQKSSSESSAEYASEEIRATVIEVEESFSGNFMIKENGKDETKGREPDDGQEELQAIDEKIRKWSRGKEGNIRSLLSTLQYVLWPNSGWRPVPLVDIIEGTAVKRAYQKALLCLHPDKLQQKGAASHHKHTAQQVYEILQEAWGHFGSLGVL